MNKICTTIEQSKKLMGLGIDVNTADMCYPRDAFSYSYDEEPVCHGTGGIGIALPAWSLSALLELIPNWQMQTQDIGIGILFGCKECIKIIDAETPIDAAFEMVYFFYSLIN